MTKVGQVERRTQDRIVKLFRNELRYDYLGNREDRPNNQNIEPDLLTRWLTRQGHDEKVVAKVLRELDKAKTITGTKNLYDASKDVYGLLRYGVKVRPEVGDQFQTVPLIDLYKPGNNEFAVAEEVAVAGENAKRPDVVLYVNGIALAVLELKRSIVSVSEGIRQNLDNQKREFIRPFFSTVQLLMAGNDTEGLRYGVIETPEKYYLRWKEGRVAEQRLDIPLTQICRKDRLLELVHDFIVYDAGTKKVCRHNQYFGVKAAQQRIRRREGGIIWHTQGSGKSLTMVWLAKWIRENVPNSRILVITDRTELDKQIKDVFMGAGEQIYKTKSGADLVGTMNDPKKMLVCSLVQKFGASEEEDIDEFIKEIESNVPKGFRPKGDIFVFVDECHRTQSGKLHDAMEKLLPDAMFIGFTGTPLLKRDKQTSIEIFGPYIHTYKYIEAVSDGVVLDLQYEARDIDQTLTAPERVDQWFDAKTRGLTDAAKAQLKKRWGTMRRVLSSKDRLQKIVGDVVLDMETRPRLMSGRGNALLVCSSISQACRTYETFQSTPLKGKCAIVTSYRPSIADIKGEESGEGETEQLLQFDVYRKMLAEHFNEPPEKAINKVEKFEDDVKKRFIEEPGQMKLLIVVDKLLTGFDAPSATYLYIDKKMQDHALFQAICRVNRLDGDDKDYGFVVDYRDLFKSLEKSLTDYTGEALGGYDKEDVIGLLKNRLETCRNKLEVAREAVKELCEPVEQPRDSQAFISYFCATVDGDDLKENQQRRVTLYKLASALLRAYANLANEMKAAGHSDKEAAAIKGEVEFYENLRREIKLASGDYIDMKMYEPGMQWLLDSYIRADESKKVSAFDDKSLVQLIVEKGKKGLDALPETIRKKPGAMAEVVVNNVRKVIIDEMATNPKFYEKMSELLDALIQERKREAIEYQAYLKRLVELAKQAGDPDKAAGYPARINTGGLKALYENLNRDEELALNIDDAVRRVKKAAWRGNKLKEREVRIAIKKIIGDDSEKVEKIFQMVKSRNDYA